MKDNRLNKSKWFYTIKVRSRLYQVETMSDLDYSDDQEIDADIHAYAETLLLCNIMAEGFRFMPLSLVRLRTIRLRTWVT